MVGASSSDSRKVLPTRLILDGSYRILRVVGSGGFGITYEAEDINLDTVVAIKEYYPYDYGERDGTLSVRPRSERHKETFDWGKANFLQEARTLARFEHPSIVRVTRVFEAHATAYMVMRFERGSSFETWLRDLRRLPTQAELDRIVAPLLDALEMLHAADFLHRDIAPDNIIVRRDGTPVLLDFGAARRAVAEMSQALTGIVKAGYSPHEQYSSDARLQGPWSDLYALGGTLYRAIAGKHPEEATLRFDEDHMPPAVQIGRGRYRLGFLTAIDACLKMRHSERPRSVAALRPMLLEDGRHDRTRLVDAPDSRTAGASRRGSSWHIILAAAVAIFGGAYGGYEFMRWQTPEDVSTEAKRKASQAEAKRAADEAARRQAELKRQADAEALRRQKEAEEKRQAELEVQRQKEAEAKRQAELKRQADAEALRRQKEAEEKRQAELEVQRQKEAEAKRQAELKRQADAEALKRQKEAEEKRQAELEVQRQKEAEAKRQAELKRQAEAEALKRQKEAEEKRQAELEVQRQKEAEAKRQAELKRQAEAEALKRQKEADERQALLDIEKRHKTEEERALIAKGTFRDCGIAPRWSSSPPESS